MKIVEVVEKQGKDKPYWNITIEGGPSKYANWFDSPGPVVGMEVFEMVKGKEYTDKQGKQRNYWNAKPDRLVSLEKRVKELEIKLGGGEPTALANSKYRDASPQPDDMNGDPMVDKEDIPF